MICERCKRIDGRTQTVVAGVRVVGVLCPQCTDYVLKAIALLSSATTSDRLDQRARLEEQVIQILVECRYPPDLLPKPWSR
jgi:hypothetical protein